MELDARKPKSGLIIPIDTELEQRLQERARVSGEPVEVLARRLLETALAGSDEPAWSRLPRSTPAELEGLAREQGVQPVADVHALGDDFWPEEESCDEFIATIRAWRQEAGP